MRRKKEASKQGQTNNKAKQHSTPKAVTCTFFYVVFLKRKHNESATAQESNPGLLYTCYYDVYVLLSQGLLRASSSHSRGHPPPPHLPLPPNLPSSPTSGLPPPPPRSAARLESSLSRAWSLTQPVTSAVVQLSTSPLPTSMCTW